jgi:hypothetical protein
VWALRGGVSRGLESLDGKGAGRERGLLDVVVMVVGMLLASTQREGAVGCHRQEGMAMNRSYYVLLVKWEEGEDWVMEFGDPERNTVKEERALVEYDGECHATKVMRVGTMPAEVMAAVASLNAAEGRRPRSEGEAA